MNNRGNRWEKSDSEDTKYKPLNIVISQRCKKIEITENRNRANAQSTFSSKKSEEIEKLRTLTRSHHIKLSVDAFV